MNPPTPSPWSCWTMLWPTWCPQSCHICSAGPELSSVERMGGRQWWVCQLWCPLTGVSHCTAGLLPAGGHFTHTGLVTGLTAVFGAVHLSPSYDRSSSPRSPDSQDSYMYLCAILKELIELRTLFGCRHGQRKTGRKPVRGVSHSHYFCPIIGITTSTRLSFSVQNKSIWSEFAAIISSPHTIQNVLSFIKTGIVTTVLL